jgi:hypothetical protein
MTEPIVLDTTIHSPPLNATEAEMLLFGLERSRAQFAWKCGGLDAAGLNMAHPPSTMTLGGLVKHMALVEDTYTAQYLTGEPIGPPWDSVDFGGDLEWEWRTSADDSPAELYTLWQAAVERSKAANVRMLADRGPDQPTKYTTETGESPNLRRFMVDMHEEYARHVGHADLLREAVDGLVGEDPPQQ